MGAEPAGRIKTKPGIRPGVEHYEIDYSTHAPPAPAPAPATAPATAPKEGPSVTTKTLPQVQAKPPPVPATLSDDLFDLEFPAPASGRDTDIDPDPIPRPLAQPAPTRPSRPVRTRGEGSPGLGLDLGDIDGNADATEALDLVGREPSIAAVAGGRSVDTLGELRERYALGDFSGALVIAEAILSDEPGNGNAQRYAESCRDVLKQMYAARLGPLDQVPTVAVPLEQLRWLTLDHRAGFLLSHVDGISTLDEILDISGMPHLDAMRIIYDLMQQKVIVLQ